MNSFEDYSFYLWLYKLSVKFNVMSYGLSQSIFNLTLCINDTNQYCNHGIAVSQKLRYCILISRSQTIQNIIFGLRSHCFFIISFNDFWAIYILYLLIELTTIIKFYNILNNLLFTRFILAGPILLWLNRIELNKNIVQHF